MAGKIFNTVRRVIVQGGGGGGGGSAIWRRFGGRADGLLAKATASIESMAAVIKPRFDATVSATYKVFNRLAFDATVSIDGQTHIVKSRFDAIASINQLRLLPAPIQSSADFYVDQAAGNSNFGSAAALLAKQTVPLSNNARVSYLIFDFTTLSTATLETASVFLTQVNNAIGASNTAVQVYTNATVPAEGSATWNADEPLAGTLRQSFTQSIPITSTEIEYVLDATARANIPGNYCIVRVLGADALGINTITTNSKEAGSGKPRIEVVQTTI
jgi:hypothetical protein